MFLSATAFSVPSALGAASRGTPIGCGPVLTGDGSAGLHVLQLGPEGGGDDGFGDGVSDTNCEWSYGTNPLGVALGVTGFMPTIDLFDNRAAAAIALAF